MKRGILVRLALALSVASLGVQTALVQPAAAAGVPSAPSNVQATVFGPTSIQLNWNIPNANGVSIRDYEVDEKKKTIGVLEEAIDRVEDQIGYLIRRAHQRASSIFQTTIGDPAEVVSHPTVVESYLGTSETAIARSGTAGAPET